MLHLLSIWLLVFALLGAGLANAVGPAAIRRDFARWGFPTWWRGLTAGLEVAAAALIVFPVSRAAGLILAAAIIAAALATVLRHRDFRHLPPLVLFAALVALALI